MTAPLVPVKCALISVSDKSKLIVQARSLAAKGVSLISTGGTFKAIKEAGLDVTEVSQITNFPEMMNGRVKTLHPLVHGGLLADRDIDHHLASMKDHSIPAIDLLVVNLYPFAETVARGGDYNDCVENIDIGGPAMIRAAAKNHRHVAVCIDSDDVAAVLADMEENNGSTTYGLRQKLAAKSYGRTAQYDAQISGWFAEQLSDPAPSFYAQGGSLKQGLRYGENPHQVAAFYSDGSHRPGVATARQVQGKELSYNNINDTDAAFELVAEFGDEGAGAKPAVAIIKHANPCGVAQGSSFEDAHAKALACDPVSAFGGIVALNGKLDKATAQAISKVFTEVIIAPDADQDALEVLSKKKNVRVLLTGGMPDPLAPSQTMRNVAGGFLYQNRDNGHVDLVDLKVVTKRQPSKQELADMLFAWRVAKHVKSNAIVYVKDGSTAGVGAGQMSRIDAARIAARKAEDAQAAAGWDEPRTKGCVCSSDAFFPFADGLLQAAEAGATAIIQPGGSIRDDEVIAAADEAGLAMVFTGMRHFRH
ncbi:MAG: bifunctional phosphoribosylaminoimidazolecarboxamide formyltransferase/IMP cyclohydrolase [Acidimicrobiales bacterium]|nr:bifunctional phosphoribosylaminoimidazolecarboxamide formyltransferase/IMP cyclohydrolase [Hyphomonadaceae bacterium]RZV44257.1 MAG: bifunctional phosphoribosylaminoimidazolecarboxamide formyltransferase/IMP cyclohydrolase [Acidimicrobiales bacterium]